MTPFAAGLITVIFVILITYFGFTKAIPFRTHYEIKVDFASSNNLLNNSPVRIAGVDVGKVIAAEPIEAGKPGARVTLRIEDIGRPIHKDATFKIRPRIFLEGNFFVDVHPGSPSAPELARNDVVPASQTAFPVQFDQLLTALQRDTRDNLQVLLQVLGKALNGPGGDGFNRSIQYWEPAFRDSAIVNEAQLGINEHDLSDYIRDQGTAAAGIDRDPDALKSFITDFNTTAAAFAREQENLEATIAELPRTLRAARPALAELNAAFPPLRRLIVDFRPAVRSSEPAIDASTPLVRQLRRLVQPSELLGLSTDLRVLVPDLARLTAENIPLQAQVRAAASCQNEVILPWSLDTVPDPNFPPPGPVFVTSVKGLPGLAGESRSFDANGQYFRVLAGNGTFTYALGQTAFGNLLFPALGANPPKSPAPDYRYDVPCETQEKPDLRTIAGPPPTEVSQASPPAELQALSRVQAVEWLGETLQREGHSQRGREVSALGAAMRARAGLEGMKIGRVGSNVGIVDADTGEPVAARSSRESGDGARQTSAAPGIEKVEDGG